MQILNKMLRPRNLSQIYRLLYSTASNFIEGSKGKEILKCHRAKYFWSVVNTFVGTLSEPHKDQSHWHKRYFFSTNRCSGVDLVEDTLQGELFSRISWTQSISCFYTHKNKDNIRWLNATSTVAIVLFTSIYFECRYMDLSNFIFTKGIHCDWQDHQTPLLGQSFPIYGPNASVARNPIYSRLTLWGLTLWTYNCSDYRLME